MKEEVVMAGAPAKVAAGAAVAKKTGNLLIKSVVPKDLPIGGGQKDALVYASGLFEYDELKQIVPKKDLMFGVMNEYGDKIDQEIIVEPIATDDIVDKFVRVKITVPVSDSIKKGQKRNVVLKKKHEPLDSAGKCIDPKNCNVASNEVTLI
jgi:hypothetical protein